MIWLALAGCDDRPWRPVEVGSEASAVDPTFESLLTVSWTQNRAGRSWVAYEVDGEVRQSPARRRAKGEHAEWLLGVPYDTTVPWWVETDDGPATDPQEATTGLDPGVPAVTVLTPLDPDAADPTPYFLIGLASDQAYADAWWTVIVDRAARPVWAWLAPPKRTSRQARIRRDGHALLLDRSSFFPEFDLGAASVVDEVLLDGTVLHEYPTPGMHHPFTDLPDGRIAYGRSVGWEPRAYTEEELAIVDRDGTIETLWSCEAASAAIGSSEGCMSNTLNYDAPRDEFLFSFFTSETVFVIDGTSGATLRTFGHAPGSFAFDPPESTFWWQHGGHYTEAGTFLTSSDHPLPSGAIETVVREYEVDEAARTLHEVWNLGVGDGIYGFQLGEAVRLPNGNTLQNFGRASRLREATDDGAIVWDLAWASTGLGHALPLADPYALVPELP